MLYFTSVVLKQDFKLLEMQNT